MVGKLRGLEDNHMNHRLSKNFIIGYLLKKEQICTFLEQSLRHI